MENLEMTSEQARLELALTLYHNQKIGFHAAKIAGLSYTAFMHVMGDRGICINYFEEDARQDVAEVRRRLHG